MKIIRNYLYITAIHICKIFISAGIVFTIAMFFGMEARCQNISIVIDPGHGGDAMGGNYEDRIERDIDLITAMAMKERLEMYDGVDVYITRDNNTDPEMSRKQRFTFAQSVNADFLISIHYNMSENHTLFGSEVWVASKGTNYSKGYAFAKLEMESFSELGLFDRGIKNKLDKNKSGEYYGILKYAEDFGIPAVIVEHCHLDEDRDSAFWNEESYVRFGVIDADNMAKFYNLSSQKLGIDNSDFVNVSVDVPDHRLDVDATEPEVCSIELIEEHEDYCDIKITASDSDTYIQYYQISTDGGKHFDKLMPWTDRESETEIIAVDKADHDINLVVSVNNKYDVSRQSDESIFIEKLFVPEPEADESENDYDDFETVETEIVLVNKKNQSEVSPFVVLIVTMIVLFITFNILFFVAVLSKKKKKKRKIKRQKEDIDDIEWDI